MNSLNKKVALILHNNFEEGEGVVTIDVLRRAGIIVDTFSTEKKLDVIGSHKISIKADKLIADLNTNDYDGLVIPGGSGCDQLLQNSNLHQIIQSFNKNKKMIAAVCGAPQVLGAAGIIDNVKIVKHPTSNNFINPDQVQTSNTFVDKNIVTGVSIGTVIPFSLEIITYLMGQEKSNEIKNQLVIF